MIPTSPRRGCAAQLACFSPPEVHIAIPRKPVNFDSCLGLRNALGEGRKHYFPFAVRFAVPLSSSALIGRALHSIWSTTKTESRSDRS